MVTDLPNPSDETAIVNLPKRNTRDPPAGFNIPDYIGPYKITGFLGRGGMGLLYTGVRVSDKSDKPKSRFSSLETIVDRLSNEGRITESQKDVASIIQDEIVKEVMRQLNTQDTQELRIPSIKSMPVIKYNLPKTTQVVAVKTINTVIAAQNPGVVERFVDEFTELQRLNRKLHPNIVRVYEFGEEGDLLFYSMELLDGKVKEGFALNIEERLNVIKQACSGLKFVHSAGNVHRDIKPSNLLMRKNNFGSFDVVITDFGIGKSAASVTKTDTGNAMGTVEFMAPEQAKDSKHVDQKADIYPLGVYLFESLTGQKPDYGGGVLKQEYDKNELAAYLSYVSNTTDFKFLVKTPNEIRAELGVDLVSEDLEAIAVKALAKLPDHRYDAEEFMNDIDNFLRGEPVIAREFYEAYMKERFEHFHKEEIRAEQLRRQKRKSRTIIGTLSALALAVTVASGWYIATHREGKLRYESLSKQVAETIALEQGSVEDLLKAEQEFARLLSEASEAGVKYEKDAVSKDLNNLKAVLEEKQTSIDSLALFKALEELKTSDPLSSRADELQHIILSKLCEYKLKKLVQEFPQDQIPSMINNENGKWNFADLSKDAEVGYYPRMLLTAYKSTQDKTFWNQFANLSLLIFEQRTMSASTGSYNDVELALGELLENNPSSELTKSFLDEADRLLARFKPVGNYFQALGSINDEKSSGMADCYSASHIELLVHAFAETGDKKYWDAYDAHMKTMLREFIKPDGSVYRAVVFAQKPTHLRELDKDFEAGDVMVKISYDRLQNNDVLASSQTIALDGLVKYYHHSRSPEALVAAKNLAEFLLDNKESDSFVWRTFIGKPLDERINQIDTHASALAANALIDLALEELGSNNDEYIALGEKHMSAAKSIMHALSTKYLSANVDYHGFLKSSQIAVGIPGGVSSAFTDGIYFMALEKLAVLREQAEIFTSRSIILKGTDQVEKSGFLREGTGNLTIDDRTILQIRKDNDNLYLSFRCFYQGELTSEQKGNEDTRANDWIEFTLDIPDDNKVFYSFMFTPSGIKRESLGPRDTSWNPEWTITTNTHPDYWEAYAVIPFNSLPGLKEKRTAEFNAYRRSSQGCSSLCYVEKYHRNLKENFDRDDIYKKVNARLILK